MTLLLALFAALGLATAEPENQSPAYLDLAWSDLLPEGEAQYIARLQEMQAVETGFDHFGAEAMPQIKTFNTVEELDGRRVRLGGYVLPFDFSGDRTISRFLLVPYVGACIHVPPPPPNQLVYVEAEEPVEITGLWDAVHVVGVLHARRRDNDLGDAAYTLELSELRPYRADG